MVHFEAENAILPNQLEFRKKIGVQDVIASLILAINNKLRLGYTTHTTFLDISKSFDLLDTLIHMKITDVYKKNIVETIS